VNKAINYRFTVAEKQILKTQKVSLKQLQGYAPDEISSLLATSPQRTKELNALAEFQSIPSLGINFAEELISQGYYTLNQLKGRSAVELFDAFEKHSNTWADPCVEDSYRLLVHYIETGDDTKRWWDFTAERKTYRKQHGFPVDRPQKAWYESGEYPKMTIYLQNK
jgi:hypothetical protein